MFPTPSQNFVYTRTYSRWLEDQNRRETWDETVGRYINFMTDNFPGITKRDADVGREAILSTSVMPSMRALWAAGPAAATNNIALYNCAYCAVDDVAAFSEALYILMSGTGFGFSVERRYTDKLPVIAEYVSGNIVHRVIIVEDSKDGWSSALKEVLESEWSGIPYSVDYSRVRPRGARLHTMGGRASGPEPLERLFNFIKKKFQEKRARKQFRMEPIDCLDILNMIAEIVVVGGVRRSSEISLSDLSDRAIAEAKVGDFWNHSPWRAMSNNSAVYESKPDPITFMEEFLTLIKSGAGERGIFNRRGAIDQMTSSGRRIPWTDVGTNPCAEILLRDGQFCNLSEIVVRENDTLASLRRKAKIAAMFGVWQAYFTNFNFLRPKWQENCEEERLLGVSLTGMMDHPVLNNVNDTMKKWLSDIKASALRTTEYWCNRLNINMSAAVTCVKPSGTVSQLVNSASGIHPRYAQHYIRRYRISATDPLFKMLRDQGFPYEPEVGQSAESASTMVVGFPIAAPVKAKTRHDYSAIDQLEHWRVVKEFWCEHNPSITVYVDDDEWVRTGSWVYDHFDDLCGVSFLPKSNHVYQLAPYEEISKSKYDELVEKTPEIDYSHLSKYEKEDNTQGSQNLACVGDRCEL